MCEERKVGLYCLRESNYSAKTNKALYTSSASKFPYTIFSTTAS